MFLSRIMRQQDLHGGDQEHKLRISTTFYIQHSATVEQVARGLRNQGKASRIQELMRTACS